MFVVHRVIFFLCPGRVLRKKDNTNDRLKVELLTSFGQLQGKTCNTVHQRTLICKTFFLSAQ